VYTTTPEAIQISTSASLIAKSIAPGRLLATLAVSTAVTAQLP
jgi:hypothetical protein